MQVFTSAVMPMEPSPGEDARRIVRHAFAEAGIMEWLGLEVGPKPGDLTQALIVGTQVYVSPDLYRKVVESPDVLRQHL